MQGFLAGEMQSLSLSPEFMGFWMAVFAIAYLDFQT
jgi:hypothetical protein